MTKPIKPTGSAPQSEALSRVGANVQGPLNRASTPAPLPAKSTAAERKPPFVTVSQRGHGDARIPADGGVGGRRSPLTALVDSGIDRLGAAQGWSSSADALRARMFRHPRALDADYAPESRELNHRLFAELGFSQEDSERLVSLFAFLLAGPEARAKRKTRARSIEEGMDPAREALEVLLTMPPEERDRLIGRRKRELNERRQRLRQRRGHVEAPEVTVAEERHAAMLEVFDVIGRGPGG